MNTPLDIIIKSDVKPHAEPYQYFDFNEMHKLIRCDYLDYDLISLGTFYNRDLEFNNGKALIELPG